MEVDWEKRGIGFAKGFMDVVEMTFEQVYKRLYNRYNKKRLHQWIDCRDFDDWEVARGRNRAILIEDDLINLSSILDIGCFHGGIANYLAVMGHSVVGIEQKARRLEIANFFKNYFENKYGQKLNCEFLLINVIDYFKANDLRLDAIIMLSVDYWIKKDYGIEYLKWLFKEIAMRCRSFYFETCRGQLKESWKMILQAGFEKYTLLGKDDGETGRELYRFEKSNIE